jgi:predicted metalloprotease with PDZ domain
MKIELHGRNLLPCRNLGEPCLLASRVGGLKPPAASAAPNKLILFALLGAAACGGAPEARCPEPHAAPAVAGGRPAQAPTPRADVALTVQPDPRANLVRVSIDASPGVAQRAWSIEAAEPGAIGAVSARDDAGPIAVAPRGDRPFRFELGRATRGRVIVDYTVVARAASISTSPSAEIDGERFRALGGAILALPDAVESTRVSVSLRMAPWGDARAASSFGVGERREFFATGRELREAMLLAGPLGEARFDAAEGHDEAAWTGYTTFDPRPISADVAAFRTAAREIFRDRTRPPMTLLIVSDLRSRGAFVASRRASSVVVHIGASEPWSGPVRIAVAAEVLHQWIGSKLWVGPTDREHEAEAYWFTEGIARHMARDLLFRFGLITPTELLDEMHGLVGTVATSPRHAETNAKLAASVKTPGALPLIVARGALYGARVDAAIRKKSGGKRRLDDVLRALYAKAAEAKGALPTSAWVSVVKDELGPEAERTFVQAIEEGSIERLPEGALGPCFQSGTRRYTPFDLGFDEGATRASSDRALRGLRAGGPAERAGAKSADVLVDVKYDRQNPLTRVQLVVTRSGERRTLEYVPSGGAARSAEGWTRRRDVADDACAK